jgi:UDP-N-acetylmuramate: L-alanyl-gamma-D-glutamyl-meso-diaminopimelate ligase
MKKIHFIAIGGAIMHQLALALKRQGHSISGSDDEIKDPAKINLAQQHLLPEKEGWFPEKIDGTIDAIVLGMHAKANNPELLKAQILGIPIYSFPEYIYEVSKDKKRVVVAGSHGKTTITSMIMHILNYAAIDFDYMVGAKVEGFDQSVKLSDAPIIILEGDEYPASIIEKKPKIFFYHPHISVLSGIAWDHINVFPTYENYTDQFVHYLSNMQKDASLYYNETDEEVLKLVHQTTSHLKNAPYGMPSYSFENNQPVIQTKEGPIKVNVLGKHNLLNMQAAIKVCMELGIAEALCYEAIASFTGAAKRLEKIMDTDGLIAFRDFAHAPSKLKATLQAVRENFSDYHLIACFELHTYSSLNEAFLKEYNQSMEGAEEAIVFYSKEALNIKGLEDLNTDSIKTHFNTKDLQVFNNKEDLWNYVHSSVNSQTGKPICLLLMSSGTFEGIDWTTIKTF